MNESDLKSHIAKLSGVAREFLNVEPIRQPLASKKIKANKKAEVDTKQISVAPAIKTHDSDDQYSFHFELE